MLAIYFAVPKKLKNAVLLLSGLIFYGWGEPRYLIIMIASIAFGYISGLLIDKFRSKAAKPVLAASIVINLAVLGYFKYADFFIENFNAVTGIGIPLLKITLPIGISFYTFQIISYLIDVYRSEVPAQKNIINFGAYVAMYPQLIAGPIVRYADVNAELENRSITLEKIYCGARRFIVGLGKKVLISNQLGQFCDIFRECGEKSVVFYWLYAIAFTLHIYFDFSGYSDMAIGLGKIMGFKFPENFDYPYISHSITEFWRRWHMTLGGWFRDYVYIPMGGNRVSKLRWIWNIIIVWALTGFWHGAEWNFICWGLMFAILLIIEKLWLGKMLDRVPRAASNLYVMFFVTISFVIFNADEMGQAISDICGIFGAAGVPFCSQVTLYYFRSYAVLLLAAMIGCTPIISKIAEKMRGSSKLGIMMNFAEPAGMIILLITATAYLVDGSFNPFLYFRF